jgi:hypothetical protein
MSSSLNYTGVFFKDGKHMTWNFGFPLTYPDNVKVGQTVKVKVVGKYEDDQVACWVVELDGVKNQPKGTLLHITIKVENGGKPVMSGLRATEKGYEKVEPFYIEGEWK